MKGLKKIDTLNLIKIVIFTFILVRIVLNLPVIFSPLGMFFVSSYVLLFGLLFKNHFLFLPAFIVFLSIDSMIGTRFFVLGNMEKFEYFGTMTANLALIMVSIWHERLGRGSI